MTEVVQEPQNGGASEEKGYPGDYVIVESGSLDDLKGPLRRSARLKFTCMDVSSRYIALGSNTGSVYVFDRSSLKHLQVVFTDVEPSPVNVVAICPANKSVAFSTTNGYVNVMEMNIEKRQKPDKLRIVTDHLHTTVTCLQWDGNGDKLFSADLLGKVVVSVIPISKVKNLVLIPVEIIMKLDSAVVQLDWFSGRLLVSDMNKVCLCNTLKQQYSQVGKKPREGAYGSMFYINPSATVPLIYSARPGSRLWEVDFDGNVLNTHQFKQMLAVPPMTVLRIGNDVCTWTEPSRGTFPPQGINFPQLKMSGEQFVLSWKKSCLYILDPANDIPCLILWAELEKEIQNISCVGTDIYIFYVNSEVQKLQLLTVTQCISLLTRRKEWTTAAKLCCYFESSILQMHHRSYLSTRSLSNLWEKMSESENGKVMDILSRILLKYESEPRSESEDDRNSDNSNRSRSSSGASIKRLESGIYQILTPRQGSHSNLQSVSMDLKVGADILMGKDTVPMIDTVKNGIKHVGNLPNGDVSVVVNRENGHTEENSCKSNDVSHNNERDVLENSSLTFHEQHGINHEVDKVEGLEDSSQMSDNFSDVRFLVGQEVYSPSQCSQTNPSKSENMLGTEFDSQISEQEIHIEAEHLPTISCDAQGIDRDEMEKHLEKEQFTQEKHLTETDVSRENTHDDMDLNSVKVGTVTPAVNSHDKKSKIEINPMINAVDIFAEDVKEGIVSKKSPKKKKKKGRSTSSSSKEKKSDKTVADLNDKSMGQLNQTENVSETSESEKTSSDTQDTSKLHTCNLQVTDENISKSTEKGSSDLNEANNENKSENALVSIELPVKPLADETAKMEPSSTGMQKSVSLEELITSFESGTTEMASISDYEDTDTVERAPETDGISVSKDFKETSDLSPLIARGLPPVILFPPKKKKAATATIVTLDEDNQLHRVSSPKEKRSYKRIQSFGSASIDVVKKSGMKKRSSIPDLFKTSEQQKQDMDPSKGEMGSSPSDSPLTQSWEGPDTPTSPKISLLAVREKVQSKFTNTKNKILKTIKESNLLQVVPNEEVSVTTTQIDEVESKFSQSSTLVDEKEDTQVHPECLIDLSDLRASTDQSKRALQNPRVLLDAELSKEVLSKWVINLNTALQQLHKLLNSQKVKLAKEFEVKEKELQEDVDDTDTVELDSREREGRTDAVELQTEDSRHPEVDTEDSSVSGALTERDEVCDDNVRHPAFESGCPIYVSDPFFMDDELCKSVSDLTQMCYSVQTYGAISEFISVGATHSRRQSKDICSVGSISFIDHSHSTRNTDTDVDYESTEEKQNHSDTHSDVNTESQSNLRNETQIMNGETYSLHKNSAGNDLPECVPNTDETLFIRCYFFLLSVEDIQNQIYKNEYWDESVEKKVFHVWKTLLECLQERCKGDTICDKISQGDTRDALDMLKSGLYTRKNSLGYLSKLFKADALAAMDFAVDCHHIEPLDILYLCVLNNLPTQVYLHQYMCSLCSGSSKLPFARHSHSSGVIYPVAKEWLQILLTMDSSGFVLSDPHGNPRCCSHKSNGEHGKLILSILSASQPSQWQIYLDMCSKHGCWIGCLVMLKKLGRIDNLLQIIFYLGDISLVCNEYYLPCSEEEWTHFVREFSKFYDQFSRVQSKSVKTSDDSTYSDGYYSDSAVSQEQGSEPKDLAPCQGCCMSWIDVADLIVQNLGVVKSVKILGQFTGEMDGLSTEFYQKVLTSAMVEKNKRNVSHNLIEKIDSYLWAQKPNTLMPQLQYAVSKEKLSGRSDENVQFVQDIKMMLRNDITDVHRYREDYECHWGVHTQMSRCRVCNLPLTEAVSHIVPGILVFPCGHIFHRVCSSEQTCPVCF